MKDRICKCGKPVVNVHYGLCHGCNNIRLHGSKYGKQYNKINKSKKSRTSRITKKKSKARKSLFLEIKVGGRSVGKTLQQDELFYERCFNESNHKCEECGKELPTQFRGKDGKILARFRYSHIIPKSIAPELRHVIKNINHLCLKDHNEWENGKKTSMKIWKKNFLRFPNHLALIKSKEIK